MTTKPSLLLLSALLLAILIRGTNVFAAEYVGSQQCETCHQPQSAAWQGSHHAMAMQHATKSSVKGDFDNVSFRAGQQISRFYRKGNQYWVNMPDANGKQQDYQIKYTFGVEPLQQYMVEFDDGRVQLIPYAWDSRAAEAGGQRWFNLYPEFTQKHQEFYWTNTGQNWNYMCADCHSTNVKKNFSVEENTYNTTFSEINVGCEACHGPASDHLSWAKKPSDNSHDKGFNRNMQKAVSQWVVQAGKTTLMPALPTSNAESTNHSQQTLVCAQCHSRHVQISNNSYVEANALGDRYLLNLIDARRYYADGQVYDEDYVYGSFLQSKMHSNGVVCSDCHDPHSAKLTLPEETVCLQCHQDDTYASQEHHHHQPASAGAQCVNCHMPITTYMQIDKRRDHGWHIPRPDFAKKLGTPDTCLNCHDDKDSAWSGQLTQTWKNTRKGTSSTEASGDETQEQHFAPVFAAIDQGYGQAANALSHIAQDKRNAPIIRASALERMRPYPSQNSLIAIARGVKSANEHIRVGAARGAEDLPGIERWRILSPLLSDRVLAVRSEVANTLLPLWGELDEQQRTMLTPALDDYLAIQDFNSDRGFAHTNKANVLVQLGKLQEAETAYKTSIRIEPYFSNAYVNLADLYRHQQKNAASIALLQTAAATIPDDGSIFYSLGLAYIRIKEQNKAINAFKTASVLEPRNAHFHYVYGLSLEATQLQQAQREIRKAYQLSASPQYLYALCEVKIRHRELDASKCINELRPLIPEKNIDTLEAQLKGLKE